MLTIACFILAHGYLIRDKDNNRQWCCFMWITFGVLLNVFGVK